MQIYIFDVMTVGWLPLRIRERILRVGKSFGKSTMKYKPQMLKQWEQTLRRQRGEIVLGVKELGSCDLYTQSLKHNPNICCGVVMVSTLFIQHLHGEL
jgi:hypothetical protein